MFSSNLKRSGSKAPANTTWAEYMDTAAEVMDTAANSVKAPKPSDAGTQAASKGAKRNKGASGREPQGFSWSIGDSGT